MTQDDVRKAFDVLVPFAPRGAAARALTAIHGLPTAEVDAVIAEHGAMVRLLERLATRTSSYAVVEITADAQHLLEKILGKDAPQ